MARKRVAGVAQESHRRFAAQLPVLRSNTLLQKQKCVKFTNHLKKGAAPSKVPHPHFFYSTTGSTIISSSS